MKRALQAGVLSLFIGTVALSSFPPATGKSQVAAANAKAELWTTYNSYYVLQEPSAMTGKYISSPEKFPVSESAPLRVDMCQGESEGVQLIMTAKEDISSFNLTVSNLQQVGGEGVIPSSDIDVYKQHYMDPIESAVEIHEENVPFIDSRYPDILIPIDSVVALQENTVDNGKNQGISIEIEAKDAATTPAGTYQGTVTLTLENEVTELPLVVTVHEIDLTEHHYMSSGASGGMSSATRASYEMMMEDFHLMAQFMPGSASSPERTLEELERYWDNPSFTNYEITSWSDAGVFYKYVYAIAQASSPEKNYLSKAVVYIQAADEPADAKEAGELTQTYVNEKERVISQLPNMFPGDDQKTVEWRNTLAQTIRDITLYIPHGNWHVNMLAKDFDVSGSIEKTGKLPLTFCFSPSTVMFGEEVFLEHQKIAGQPMWTYVNSGWPEMGYSLPNYGHALVNLGWFCAEMDMVGKLFWDIDMVRTMIPGMGTYESRDYYNNSNSFDTGTGGGGQAYLVVQAKKYGEPDEWLPTLRLRNFRDGAEDYDLLYELEELYNSKLNAHGLTELDFDKSMEWVYDKGFDWRYYVPDNGKTVLEMKKIAMDLYELADSDFNFLLTGIEKVGKTATATMYANTDTLTVNGQTVQKQNGKYVFSWDYSENPEFDVVLTKDGKTETFSASTYDFGPLENGLKNLTSENVMQYVTSSTEGFALDKIPAGTASFEDGTLKFNITRGEVGEMVDEDGNVVVDQKGDPVTITMTDAMGYMPRFTLGAEMFDTTNLKEVYYVNMKVRIKLKGKPLFRGEESDQFTVTVGALSEMDIIMGTIGKEVNSFTFTDEYLTSDGWYERDLCFLIEHLTEGDVAALGFTLTSFHANSYNMGAYVEIPMLWYSAYPFGEGGTNQ